MSLAIAASATRGHAADADGSRDHPLIGRYQGSEIAYFRDANLDEAFLLRAPHDYATLSAAGDTKNRSGAEWLRLEGAVTQIRYALPRGRSSFEVMRNQQQTLAARGFTTVFSCNNADCLVGKLRDPYLIGQQLDGTNNNPSLYETQIRYLLAKLDQPAGPIHVAVLVGEFKGTTTAYLEVVEPERKEPAVVAAPKAPDAKACPLFAGKWKNVDPKTRSIAEAITTGSCVEQGGKFVFKGWGACTPRYCEWDPLELRYDATSRRLVGEQKLNYAREAFSITLGDDDRLSVGISTIFTDTSGRQPMTTVDILQRVN